MALPFLEAMLPAMATRADAAAASALRMGFFYFPHGAILLDGDDRWTPAGEGRSFELSRVLRPFEPFKERLTIVSCLRNKPAESPDPHGITPGTWLRCAPPGAADGGTSADQIAARHIGQSTPFPSIEVAAEGKAGPAGAAGNAFGNTISFRTPTQGLPMEFNPRKVFFKLFGEGASPAEREAIIAETGSILDFTLETATHLRGRLGRHDVATLESYLDSVREVERRVQKIREQDLSDLDLPPPPLGVPEDFREQQTLLFDLLALAYQGDVTRIANYMMAAEASMKAYNHLGISDAFHPLSHHGNNPDSLDKLERIQTYHSEIFAEFLAKLDAMPEAEGSVLDNSILLYGSNMSNSDLHNNDPLPSAVFGLGGGTIRGGQHLLYPRNTPFANLLLTLLVRAGVPVESFADSTGELTEV
ncbi:MAG: DUF1552 domain-containing protein [Gammaproteobacteria bacterium]|nr:DUF1552 domain-containing protein [Gammaproteobacteria bacterium]